MIAVAKRRAVFPPLLKCSTEKDFAADVAYYRKLTATTAAVGGDDDTDDVDDSYDGDAVDEVDDSDDVDDVNDDNEDNFMMVMRKRRRRRRVMTNTRVPLLYYTYLNAPSIQSHGVNRVSKFELECLLPHYSDSCYAPIVPVRGKLLGHVGPVGQVFMGVGSLLVRYT